VILKGRVWKYGDGINTDVIFPGKYTYTVKDPKEQALHVLEDLDPQFAREVQEGDFIVAGRNWGNGSSREQAVGALKAAGVKAIIAKSFARIYFRNAVNNGLLPIVCADAADAISNGDNIEIDLVSNKIRASVREFTFPALSPSLLAIVEAGGLIPMLRREFGAEDLPMPETKGGD
jgi:3-isopropylmalate/(R)-2-methylmalate dehydratase small subunit